MFQPDPIELPLPILSCIIDMLECSDYYCAIRINRTWLKASRLPPCRTPQERQDELFFLSREETNVHEKLKLLTKALCYSGPFKCHIYAERGEVYVNYLVETKNALMDYEKAVGFPSDGSELVGSRL